MNPLSNLYQQKHLFLKSALQNFHSLSLQPKIGIEWEFYLLNNQLPANSDLVTQFIDQLKIQLHNQNIFILDIEPEQGNGQIEIKTKPYSNIELLCADFLKIKDDVKNLAAQLGTQINFSSQPYPDDCGSALQINFSLMDKNNNLLFVKDSNQESPLLLHSIAGLLNSTSNFMLIFAPQEDDYWRFDLDLNKNLYRNKKYTAPVNISWGYNNRTALIRIPAVQNNIERRLEFRLAASDADIYLVNTFFLLAVLEGIKNHQTPIESIYGNVFDEQYDLAEFPKNYSLALEKFLSHFPNLEFM
jgi:glutamine synthetase